MFNFPLRLSHVTSGFLAVLVGYTSSVAIVFQAVSATGADQAMINSWLLSLGLGMAITCIGLSLYYKTPIITAWSTPGAALLATSLVGIPMSDAVGAFLFSAVLITVSGLTGSFERLSKIVSPEIAAAMLAGVLVQFCLEIFVYIQQEVVLVGSMCAVFLIGRRWFPLYAIPMTLLLGILISWQLDLFTDTELKLEIAEFVFTMPTFSFNSFISIGVPLFIVTMSSQNMPGIAVIKAAEYHPPISPLITTTGITTILLAPFGGFAFNLAAITAAICMGEDAGKNKDTRYLAGVSAGVFYLIAAVFGATIVALFAMSPKALILPLAGLALLGTLGNSLATALDKPSEREAALITFLVTSSGLVFFGIGAAFWGLLAGILVQIVLKKRV
ncbi:UNVERIFIED_CONTAM: hypothetical protein GTU68_022317 [Idotea baltica]|nr:hypothetical protein [Idotea baltica]